jgi:hypothetical protein
VRPPDNDEPISTRTWSPNEHIGRACELVDQFEALFKEVKKVGGTITTAPPPQLVLAEVHIHLAEVKKPQGV